MIANDIVKDKRSVFFDPISRQVNSKSEMMSHTKVARKEYLWPYSSTSSWTGTMMHASSRCALRNAFCMVNALDSNNRENIGFEPNLYICRRYCVAYAFTKELRILW